MNEPRYFRIMLGSKSVYAKECFDGGFIGIDFGLTQDLKPLMPSDWTNFNSKFIPLFLNFNPEKSKIAAGLAGGAAYRTMYGIEQGDIILSPKGDGDYLVGEVIGDYEYCNNLILPHRRSVRWFPKTISRADMSVDFQKSTGSTLTIIDINQYSPEIEQLMQGNTIQKLFSTDSTIENPTVFALEKHLEDFLIGNWKHTLLGIDYDIFEEDGEMVGQQYPSDTGPIDILARSKDKQTLLVVELKRGRASDSVVGQIQRYMGYVQDVLAEDGQKVRGVIIALEDDLRIKRALQVTRDIEFYKYQVSFELLKT